MKPAAPKKTMSAAASKKISLAMKARYANMRAGNGTEKPAPASVDGIVKFTGSFDVRTGNVVILFPFPVDGLKFAFKV